MFELLLGGSLERWTWRLASPDFDIVEIFDVLDNTCFLGERKCSMLFRRFLQGFPDMVLN
jgi:hypothetical protein